MVIINLLFTKTRFLNEFNLIKYECGLLSYTRNTLEVGRATYRFLVNGEWSGALRSASDAPGPRSFACTPTVSRREGQEAFIRRQDISLHVILDYRTAVERLHRTDQRHPVQHFMLPGKFHLGQRALAPNIVIGTANGIEQQPVTFVIRPQITVFRRQEGMRPARRCDQCRPIGRGGQYLGDGGADLHAAPGCRCWRVFGLVGWSRWLEQMGKAAFGMKQGAAVAVDRERDHRIGKARPVPVEIKKCIGKGMGQRMVQRLVGVGHVDAALDQPSGEELRRLAMALKL